MTETEEKTSENLEELAKELLAGKHIIIASEPYQIVDEEINNGIFKGETVTSRIGAYIETNNGGCQDIVVEYSREFEECVDGCNEIYRLPFIEDLNVLTFVLTKIKEQYHWN